MVEVPAAGTGPVGTAQLAAGLMAGTGPGQIGLWPGAVAGEPGSPVGTVAGWQSGTVPVLRQPAGTGAVPGTVLGPSD